MEHLKGFKEGNVVRDGNNIKIVQRNEFDGVFIGINPKTGVFRT